MGKETEILGGLFTAGIDFLLDPKIIGIMKRSSGYVHGLKLTNLSSFWGPL